MFYFEIQFKNLTAIFNYKFSSFKENFSNVILNRTICKLKNIKF